MKLKFPDMQGDNILDFNKDKLLLAKVEATIATKHRCPSTAS
jgi:hypothetical protein